MIEVMLRIHFGVRFGPWIAKTTVPTALEIGGAGRIEHPKELRSL